ncbi:MAG TPA: HAMP domain-containing protein, partial [Agromyces sp.]|nr:HAMP domain-containing protein [Agromyces sp.]
MSAAEAPAHFNAASWREVPRRLAALWRRSLQFRTVIITLALSGLAIFIIGLYISFSIASNLFDKQLDDVLAKSNSATSAAQRILDSSDAADRAALQSLMSSTVRTVQSISGSDAIAYFREPSQPASSLAPPDQVAPSLGGRVITPELRARVQQNEGEQFWQSVALANGDGGTDPGVVVGSDVVVPSVGRYELYIGYNFGDAQQTLAFMQVIGLIGAAALLVLLSAITLLVVRWVIEPIRTVAATSRRLASGDLGVRMPSKGEDELAT